MKIAYVVYPDFTALDLVGPYEVISRWPGAEVHMVARLARTNQALSGQLASSRRPVEPVCQEQSLNGTPAEPAPTDARVAGDLRDQSG